MKRIIATLVLVILQAVTIQARTKKVILKLDYTELEEWSYLLDYRSECVIEDKDSTQRVKTRVLCDITGRPVRTDKGNRMNFTMDTIRVNSEIFTTDQRNKIVQKLTGKTLGIALNAGAPLVDTLETFSVSELTEWDLVIQFAKLVPFMPAQAVRKGYSWDQNDVYMINTTLGKIPCDVYRLYEIDSISADGNRVYLSWQFNYSATKMAVQRSDLLKKVPISGKGKGTGIIDVRHAYIVEATVSFKTPVSEFEGTKIYWEENTLLKYKPLPGLPAE